MRLLCLLWRPIYGRDLYLLVNAGLVTATFRTTGTTSWCLPSEPDGWELRPSPAGFSPHSVSNTKQTARMLGLLTAGVPPAPTLALQGAGRWMHAKMCVCTWTHPKVRASCSLCVHMDTSPCPGLCFLKECRPCGLVSPCLMNSPPS